jgi:hypothetical protein
LQADRRPGRGTARRVAARANPPVQEGAIAQATRESGVAGYAAWRKASSAGIELPAAQTLSTINFTGATLADTGAFPPDCQMGAVGPTHHRRRQRRIRSFVKTTESRMAY